MIERILFKNIKITFIIILLLGIFLRTLLLFPAFSGSHSWNEGYYSMIAKNFDKYGIGNQMSYRGKDLSISPFLPGLIYFSTKIFGSFEWAARLPVFIFGILSLIAIYFIAKELFNKKIAIISMLFSAVAPGIVYYSRNIQLESPSVFFILAAIYLLLKSPDIKNAKDTFNIYLVLSLISMSLAVFVKYYNIFVLLPLLVLYISKIKDSAAKRTNLERHFNYSIWIFIPFIVYSLLVILPSVSWIIYSGIKTGGGNKWYFWRPHEWSFGGVIYALLRTPATIGDHLNFFIYLFSIVGIVYIFKNWRKNLFLITYILPWFSLLFFFPAAYIANSYYDYPALYGLAVCAAIGFFEFDKKKVGNVFFVSGIVLSIATAIYVYINYEGSCFNVDLMKKYKETSYYSAKHVSGLRKNSETVVVGWPAEMYYAGGDPEYVTCSFDDTRKFIPLEKYDYIVLNYCRISYDVEDKELANNFRRHNYTRIAPLAWKKK
jgi:4-amino-4-deoxy-L-arabinose transferase-like glycosyltransferase